MAGEELRFPIGIPIETNADEAATSVESLRDAISSSKNSIKDAVGALKNLRGSSDEVKAAKDQLRVKIDQEKKAISDNQLAMMKASSAAGALGDKSKQLGADQGAAAKKAGELSAKLKTDATQKATAHHKALSDAVSRAGGPVADLQGKIKGLGEAMSDGSGFATALAGGAAAAAAAILALVAAVGAAVVTVVRFAIKGADAERTLNLMRLAAVGTASNAEALGTQVDALAGKVSTSKEALNGLAISLAKNGVQGQTLVDTFNAVGQASAALGDDAGGKLKEFVERGRLMQNFQINPQEMIGTGLSFQDVAGALAENLKVGVKDAQKALVEGRVKLGDGAAALRKAVEAKFSEINIEKMFSLSNITETITKQLAKLTGGIDLKPLTRGFAKFAALLDESSVTGDVLKRALTAVGNAFGAAFEAGMPLLIQVVKGMVLGGLELYSTYLDVKNALVKAFGDTSILKNVDLLSAAATAGKVAVGGIAAALVMTAGFAAAAAAPFVVLAGVITGVAAAFVTTSKLIEDSVGAIRDAFTKSDWAPLGMSIIDGLISGLTGGASKVVDAVTGLAGKIKDGFTGTMKIRSPSQVFAEYGEHTTAGFVEGVEGTAANAQGAVNAMVAPPAAGGAPGRGGSATVTVNINMAGGAGGGEKVSQSILDQITKAVLDGCASAGIAVAA